MRDLLAENKLLYEKLNDFMTEEEIRNYIKDALSDDLSKDEVIYREEHWKSNKNQINNEKIDDKSGFIYIIKEMVNDTLKIGKAKNVRDRLDHFEVKLPFDFEVLYQIPVANRHEAEKIMHNKFEDRNVNGEWFKIKEEDVDKIITDPDLRMLVSNEWLESRDRDKNESC